MRAQAKTLRMSRKKDPKAVRRATLSRYGTSWVAATAAAYRTSMTAEALGLPSMTPKPKASAMRSIS